MSLKLSCIVFFLLMNFGLNCFGQSIDAEFNFGGRVRIDGGTRPSQQTPSSINQTRGTVIDGVEFYEIEAWLWSNAGSRKIQGTKFVNHNNYNVRVNVGSLWLDLAPRQERELPTWPFQMVNSSEIRVTGQ